MDGMDAETISFPIYLALFLSKFSTCPFCTVSEFATLLVRVDRVLVVEIRIFRAASRSHVVLLLEDETL